MKQVITLIKPRWWSFRKRGDRRGSGMRFALFGGVGLLFWGGIFAVTYRVLSYFKRVEDFGDILAFKLLSMVLVTFFSLLIFSAILTTPFQTVPEPGPGAGPLPARDRGKGVLRPMDRKHRGQRLDGGGLHLPGLSLLRNGLPRRAGVLPGHPRGAAAPLRHRLGAERHAGHGGRHGPAGQPGAEHFRVSGAGRSDRAVLHLPHAQARTAGGPRGVHDRDGLPAQHEHAVLSAAAQHLGL